MLITSFGSDVSSRVCASFAVLGTVGQSFLSTLLKLDVRIQGLLLGCAVILNFWCGFHFSSTQSMVCKPLHDSQQLVRCLRVGKSLVRAARRIAKRRVKWPRRRPRHPRMRVRRCVFRWRMILSWWIGWLTKLSCGSLRLVERTPKQQCEDLLSDLWGGGQSEAELNKRLLAGLGELLRSVTSSPPARREEGVRDQQAQSQRHQQGKKNRRAKRKAERDNSLVGGLQRLVDRMSKPTFSGDPLVRLKQFIEAAEKESKGTGKDKKRKRSNEKSESSSGGSSGSRGAKAVGRTAAGKEEQDDWKPVGKAGKSHADVVEKREQQLPIKPEGLQARHWSTVVDLADFISCFHGENW